MEAQQRLTRLGMFTASSIHALLTSGKRPMTEAELAARDKADKRKTVDTIFGDTAMTYIHEKIAEIITGECKPQLKGVALDWGNEYEKDAYLWLNKTHPHEYLGKENFKFFNYNDYAGGSPDGLSDTHVFEYKCPYVSSNHVGWLLNGSQEWVKDKHPEYYTQVQFNMLCCNRQRAIIASYDPRTVEPEHRMAIVEMEMDEELLSELKLRIQFGVEIITRALKSLPCSK